MFSRFPASALLLCLDGAVVVRGPGGERAILAAELYLAPLTTSLAADEVAVEARFTLPPPGAGWGFAEVARRHGDFALVEFAPFTDATVLHRDDGDWFVYIEVDDGNRTPDLVEAAGSECIVGGTIAEPEWQSFGVISRDVAEDSIADYNRGPAQP